MKNEDLKKANQEAELFNPETTRDLEKLGILNAEDFLKKLRNSDRYRKILEKQKEKPGELKRAEKLILLLAEGAVIKYFEKIFQGMNQCLDQDFLKAKGVYSYPQREFVADKTNDFEQDSPFAQHFSTYGAKVEASKRKLHNSLVNRYPSNEFVLNMQFFLRNILKVISTNPFSESNSFLKLGLDFNNFIKHERNIIVEGTLDGLLRDNWNTCVDVFMNVGQGVKSERELLIRIRKLLGPVPEKINIKGHIEKLAAWPGISYFEQLGFAPFGTYPRQQDYPYYINGRAIYSSDDNKSVIDPVFLYILTRKIYKEKGGEVPEYRGDNGPSSSGGCPVNFGLFRDLEMIQRMGDYLVRMYENYLLEKSKISVEDLQEVRNKYPYRLKYDHI